jgi:transcriptional regulator of acetoin/glycerol metabolism
MMAVHMPAVPDSSRAENVERALVNYLAFIVGSSRALLRECAHDDVRRREIQEIHDAAGAAVHLIASTVTAPDAGAIQELRALERGHIVRVLGDLHGNKLAAAKRLGISRRTLYRRLARHGLMPPAGSGL